MPCYHPITAYRSPRCVDIKSGKQKLFFKKIQVQAWPGYETLQVSCGQCIGCRLERSRQWAVRCVHEASLYENNCFITLTYDDKHLPKDKSLVLKHFQNFMKRLRDFAVKNKKFKKLCRKKFGKDFNSVRFFHCGEYGTICFTCQKSEHYHNLDMRSLAPSLRHNFEPALGRPHYHACLFDFDFPDLELAPIKQKEIPVYVSKFLKQLWKFGFSTVGRCDFDSAAYVARYVCKKINGEKAEKHYAGRKPEYTTMSRGGRTGKGLAYGWYTKFKSDVFPCDNVVLRGKILIPPRYYDRCLESEDPAQHAEIKAKRKAKAEKNSDDNTPERLAAKERCKIQQAKQLKRGYENE